MTIRFPAVAEAWRRPGGRARDALACAVLLLVGSAHCLARAALRPDLVYTADDVSGEGSNQLLRADLARSGRLVYRDFASQYGPLPPYAYAASSALTGNTIRGGKIYHLFLRLLSILIIYALLRKSFAAGLAFALVLATVLPMLLPYGVFGTFAHIEYIPLEIAILCAVMAAYSPPGRRAGHGYLALGLLLGLWQWVKFGGAVVAGLAIVGLDLLWLIRVRAGRAAWAGWLSGSIRTLAAFLVLEALRAALVFSTCPADVARDSFWPSYLISAYAVIASRWPVYQGSRFFAANQLLALAALGLGGIALLRDWLRGFPEPAARSAGGHLAWVFFAIGLPLYFKHEYLIYQYAWVLIPAGCLAAGRLRAACVAWLLAGLLAWAFIAKATVRDRPAPDVEPMALRDGEVFYGGRDERGAVEALGRSARRIRDAGASGDILYIAAWKGGGFYHYLDRPIHTRNWLFVPHGFRPYDDRELLAGLDGVSALLWIGPEGPEERLRGTFSPALLSAVLERFPRRSAVEAGKGWVTVIEAR